MMEIEQIEGVQATPDSTKTNALTPADKNNQNFQQVMDSALEKVSETEHAAEEKAELMANGQIDNLHDVMISSQKAKLMVDTTVEVQQKVIDLYNEMMRIQI